MQIYLQNSLAKMLFAQSCVLIYRLKGQQFSFKGDLLISKKPKEAAPKAAKKAAKAEEPALDLPKVEKTTLGDLSALADLKASMEAEAEKPAKKATKKEE